MLKNICCIQFREGSKEELLPDFSPDFPHIASYVELDKLHPLRFIPWHWHKEVELFYVESGVVEYHIPKGTFVFPAGHGGLLNSNVLHMTQSPKGIVHTVQLEHLFDPSLIGGTPGSRIEKKYILPLTTAAHIGVIPLDPGWPQQASILESIRRSFQISSEEYGYEVRLRDSLSDIWCRILAISAPLLDENGHSTKNDDKLKMMIIYIHEHFRDKITVGNIAGAAFISERECFRTFQECLRTTPVEYLKAYRLQQASRMLAQGRESVTLVSQACGLGSSSYFGKVFREHTGYSPLEYRRRYGRGNE